jgi:hypothetical protein
MTTTSPSAVLQRSWSVVENSSSTGRQMVFGGTPTAGVSVLLSTPPGGGNVGPVLVPKATTNAPCVATRTTEHSAAQYWHLPTEDILKVVTPFKRHEWEKSLVKYNLFDRFADIPKGIHKGFDMGVSVQLSHTYTPPNHRSALENTGTIDRYINKEHIARRYSGPFEQKHLEQLIGPFRTSPLGTVPKAGTNELRMIYKTSRSLGTTRIMTQSTQRLMRRPSHASGARSQRWHYWLRMPHPALKLQP